jgi:hypothetical protein
MSLTSLRTIPFQVFKRFSSVRRLRAGWSRIEIRSRPAPSTSHIRRLALPKRILAYTIDGELLERLRCLVWTAEGGFLEQRHPPGGWVGKRENAGPIAQPVLTPLVATGSIRAPDVLETDRRLACRGSSWVAVQFATRARASCRVSSRLPRERVRICRRSGMFLRRYASSCAPIRFTGSAVRCEVQCGANREQDRVRVPQRPADAG